MVVSKVEATSSVPEGPRPSPKRRVQHRTPEDYVDKLPEARNPLPIRVGAVGALAQSGDLERAFLGDRYLRWAEHQRSHGLFAYGFDAPSQPVRSWEAPFVRRFAQRVDLELHDGSWDYRGDHRTRIVPRTPYDGCPNALPMITARWMQNAEAKGATTFSYQPPAHDGDPAAAAGDDLDLLLGHLDDAGGAPSVRLHLQNGYHRSLALADVEGLLEFCKNNRGVSPTFNVANAHATGQCPSTVDGWKALLRRLPADALLVYACVEDATADGIQLRSYVREGQASPPLRPLLVALRELGRPTTLLTRAPHEDFTAVTVVEEVCRAWGLDVAKIAADLKPVFKQKQIAPRRRSRE